MQPSRFNRRGLPKATWGNGKSEIQTQAGPRMREDCTSGIPFNKLGVGRMLEGLPFSSLNPQILPGETSFKVCVTWEISKGVLLGQQV